METKAFSTLPLFHLPLVPQFRRQIEPLFTDSHVCFAQIMANDFTRIFAISDIEIISLYLYTKHVSYCFSSVEMLFHRMCLIQTAEFENLKFTPGRPSPIVTVVFTECYAIDKKCKQKKKKTEKLWPFSTPTTKPKLNQ